MVGILIMSLTSCSCQEENSPRLQEARSQVTVFPENGAYTGAFMDFGATEDEISLDILEDFEKMSGKHQTIVAFSSFWGEQNFPMKNVQIISHYGAIPLIFWSPWDRPYTEDRGPDRFNLKNILAGMWDNYIDQWADQAKDYGKPILVSWGLEMNGYWFPWSGYFYGGGTPVTEGEPNRYQGPEVFKQAYRYVVNRVRTRGAKNILWGFHANNFTYPDEPWNSMDRYYPGSDYVDWLGLSVYGKQFPDDDWISFHTAMNSAYENICKLDSTKPVIVAEWGVGEFPRAGSKSEWIREAFTALETEYPRVKAAVYWHERWRNKDDTYSNLHINSSPEALEAYRAGVAAPHWLGHLQYEIEKPNVQ